jgi:hypothetical protein
MDPVLAMTRFEATGAHVRPTIRRARDRGAFQLFDINSRLSISEWKSVGLASLSRQDVRILRCF